MRTLLLLLIAWMTLLPGIVVADEYDVVVYGATPGGIAAAVAAAREGARVFVIEPSRWIGGMVAGGLSSTDKGREDTIGGIAREFFTRAAARYDGKYLWYAEPHANLETFEAMLREAKVTIVRGRRVHGIACDGKRVRNIYLDNGTAYDLKVLIDATYEGDLISLLGVSSIVGRESRDDYSEPLAGFRLEKIRNFSAEVMTQGCPCVGESGPHYVHGAPTKIAARDSSGKLLWGVTKSHTTPGSGDRLTQSYNFRFCATQRPDILVPWPKPRRYDPARYELLLRLIQAYPGIPFSRLVHLGKIAGGKVDLNAQGLFSTDYVGGNVEYPDGGVLTRQRIRQDHVDYLQGFFWFLAHDERVPEKLRQETQSWGLCRDEFADNGHWPYALYVREARRMKGAYVMRQQDVQQEITKPDSIAMGSFIIDSHIVQRLVDADGNVIDEGAFDAPTRPYQIPYRSLTPVRGECENLLVPVCLSASHVACCSIRMEPVYMACGHAAGVAAAMTAKKPCAVQEVDMPALQAKLREQKQVLELKGLDDSVLAAKLPGIVQDDEAAELTGAWASSNFTAGIDVGYRHDMNSEKGRKSARFELQVPHAGEYEVRLAYTTAPNRATNVPVTIEHASGSTIVVVDERRAPPIDGHFVSLGKFRFGPDKPAVIVVSNDGTDGYVVIDAVQLLAVASPEQSTWDHQAAEDAKQDRTAIPYDGVKPNSMVCDTTLRELPDGSWILLMLAGGDSEPSPKNYTGVTRSTDQGKTWTPLVPLDVGFPREGKTIGQGPTELMVLGKRATLCFSTHSQHWGLDWKSWMMTSDDSCRTWSTPVPAPGRLANFTFLRDHIVAHDGRILLPFQHYLGPGPKTPPLAAGDWKKSLGYYVSDPRNGVLISSDSGKTWSEHGNIRLTDDDRYHGWAENNIVELADGRIVMLIRADRLGGVLYRADSADGGRTWPEFAVKTDIPNPGSKAVLYSLGGDTVALVHNPNPKHRSPLALWISFDGMQTWPYRRVLVPESCDGPKGRLNYPDGFVSRDKQYLHFAFDDNRHRAVYYGAKLPPLPAEK